jgi:hypothetical protein
MPTTETRAGHIFAALDLANLFRRAIGEPELDLLPVADAKPQEATECVLALAFNAGCEIDYDHSGEFGYPEYNPSAKQPFEFYKGGAVKFHRTFGEHTAEVLAKQFAEESGVEAYEQNGNGAWLVPLRDEITEIATSFDERELHTLITEEERRLIDVPDELIEQL